jgi:hypothetical protein
MSDIMDPDIGYIGNKVRLIVSFFQIVCTTLVA